MKLNPIIVKVIFIIGFMVVSYYRGYRLGKKYKENKNESGVHEIKELLK